MPARRKIFLRIVIADPRTREVPVPRRFVCHSVEDQNCQVRFTFTGKIDKLTITLEPPRLTPEDVKTLQAAKASAANAHKPRDVRLGSELLVSSESIFVDKQPMVRQIFEPLRRSRPRDVRQRFS